MSEPFALVIEDDLDASIIFSKALEAAGCKAEIISKGDEALARIKDCQPTLVVLDLHLPNVDGTDILASMRADPRHAKTIVILATADPRMAETVKELADLVLLKPVTFTQVRDFAIRLLRRYEAEKAVAASEAAPASAEAPTAVDTPAAVPEDPAQTNTTATSVVAEPQPVPSMPAATAPSVPSKAASAVPAPPPPAPTTPPPAPSAPPPAVGPVASTSTN
jgi:DNA-binding response OmpR family regulator